MCEVINVRTTAALKELRAAIRERHEQIRQWRSAGQRPSELAMRNARLKEEIGTLEAAIKLLEGKQ